MKGRDSRMNLFKEGGTDVSIDAVTSIGRTEQRNKDLIMPVGPITRSELRSLKLDFKI